jgi:ornithine cyclodeaminase/alanine dehydrogenase-like protein (mu-crystallin family)
MTVEVVTVFESNRDLPSHLATIGVYDPRTGACQAFMDGAYITAIRTSAAAAVACDVLARPDSRVLAIIGAGVQGEHNLRTSAASTKAMGHVVEDIAAAELVYAAARRSGTGAAITL